MAGPGETPGFRKPTEAEINLADTIRRRQASVSREVEELWDALAIAPYRKGAHPFAKAQPGMTFEPRPDRSMTYRMNGDVLVRGDGRTMAFEGPTTTERLRVAIAIAAKTYGVPLVLVGPPSFTAQALSVAVDLHIPVINPELQLVQSHMRKARGLHPTRPSAPTSTTPTPATEAPARSAPATPHIDVTHDVPTAVRAAEQERIVKPRGAPEGRSPQDAALAADLLDALNARPSWDTVHEVLETHGLIYAEYLGTNDDGPYRGGGLWGAADRQWYARPSDIDGALGIGALEKVLGKFTGESIDLDAARKTAPTPQPEAQPSTPSHPPSDTLAPQRTLVTRIEGFDPDEALKPAPGSTITGELVAYDERAAYLATTEGHAVEAPLPAAAGHDLGDRITVEMPSLAHGADSAPQAELEPARAARPSRRRR